MNQLPWRVLLLSAGLSALAAAPALYPEDLVRQGNAAYDRGEFGQAAEAYLQAAERTTDPGLVAFNEGVALYQQGRYRDAELHFRRAREDAQGERRARLLYNLGNCLVQQGRSQDIPRLKEAMAVYEECLQQPSTDAVLAADARHNLELARLLLQQARARKEGSNAANEELNQETPPPSDDREDSRNGGTEATAPTPDGRGKMQRAPEAGGDTQAAAQANQKPTAGKGDLPPIPDDEDASPLTPEDVVQHLQEVAALIAAERRTYRTRPVPPPPPNVKDW
jgi:tetratricopeptide (TPR) repeat protein